MKKLSLPQQLVLLILASVGITVFASVTYHFTLQKALKNAGGLTLTATADLTRCYNLLAKLSQAQSAVQNLLRQKDPDEIEAALAQLDQAQKDTLVMIQGCGEDGKAIIPAFSQLGERQKAVVDQLLKGNSGLAYEQFLSAYNPQYDAVLKEVETFSHHVQKEAELHLATQQKATRKSLLWRDGSIATVLLFVMAAVWRMKNRISESLGNLAAILATASNSLTASASQVSAASQSLAEGASEQAASLEETSASLEEMSSMTKRNESNAQQAKLLAGQARTAADTGAGDMREMTSAMSDIKSASDNIGKILKTIDEIAFQTNILALNAAVEAARAGEAGMGFAVVADEVRNLAQRSAQAARETAEKITDSVNQSERGVTISMKVASGLTEIVDKARQVDELVAQIATASTEQSQGIGQANIALSQMDKVTQGNAASAEESASAAQELYAQTMPLQQAVHQLETLLGKTSSAPQTATASSLPLPATNGKHHSNGTSSRANGKAAMKTKAAPPLEHEFQNF
jgi:methyl-accepting chemotaxis protein